MFKKPNRSLRVRKAKSSEDEEEEEEEEMVPDQVFGKRQKSTIKRGLACGTRDHRTALSAMATSMDEENDDDKEDQESEVEDTDVPEDLGRQERAGGPRTLLSFTDEREGEEISFKIKKPSVNSIVFNVRKKPENGDNSKAPENNVCTAPEGDHSQSESSSHSDSSSSVSSSPSLSPVGSAGEIPDAKTISAARRRRAGIRAQGNFLPLEASHEGTSSSHSESDDELDDHERRRQFAPGMKTLKDKMAEEMGSESDSGEHEESEHFQDEWEEQQIRKAIKYPQVLDEDLVPRRLPSRIQRETEPRFSLPLVTIGDIKKKLSTRLSSLEEVHRSHVQESDRYTHDLESSKHSLEMLGRSVSEQSYKFFKEMKTYVENFVDCVNEKIMEINKLESEMFTLFENRARSLLQRRQHDVRSESSVTQICGVENSSILEADVTTKNLLKDLNFRRSRRRQRRELEGLKDHCEGMSSDDEMPTDEETSFHENRARITMQCKDLFDDVHEDFCRIKNILSKFQEWRQRFSESYYDAYISLCIPKLLNALLREQLLNWNPLESANDLEQFEWYRDLEDFCCGGGDSGTNLEDSPDHNVLSAVIEKCVLPKVSEFVDHVWDPLSTTQTTNLIRFCKTYVLGSESNKAVQGLLNGLVSRLKKAIEDDVFIPLYPKSVLEDETSQHSKFQERQFWSAVKMLQNVLSWDGFLQEVTLQELGLDKLLNRYLLLILLNALPGPKMIEKCIKIVECIPQSWFKGLDSGSSITRLSNFSKHLLQCALALHASDDRENLLVLVSLLKKIKATDCVEAILSKCNIMDLKESML